jgi:hypothetical protein
VVKPQDVTQVSREGDGEGRREGLREMRDKRREMHA